MLMRKPGEDPIMTPAQLEALESDLRERAKPLGDRHWIDGTQRLASDLADVVAHLRAMEQDAEQGFHDAQQAANAEPLGVPVTLSAESSGVRVIKPKGGNRKFAVHIGAPGRSIDVRQYDYEVNANLYAETVRKILAPLLTTARAEARREALRDAAVEIKKLGDAENKEWREYDGLRHAQTHHEALAAKGGG